MSRRGYFEQQGDEYRLRIVKPGFDADDPGVSPNNVIIDSHSLGTLSVVKSGVGVIPNRSTYDAGLWIASGWGLPYIPLCTFLFGYPGAGGSWTAHPPIESGGLNDFRTQLHVTRNGIYMKGGGVFISTAALPLYVHYTAYRLPV